MNFFCRFLQQTGSKKLHRITYIFLFWIPQAKLLWATAGSGFVCHVIKVSPTPQMLKMRTISSFDEVLFSTSLWWYISQFHGKRKLPMVRNRIIPILKEHSEFLHLCIDKCLYCMVRPWGTRFFGQEMKCTNNPVICFDYESTRDQIVWFFFLFLLFS